MAWPRYSTRWSPAYLALTLTYAITGKLALLLAVPPGYASPVFPPAGIAVSAMLIGGWTSLPWTFLGSLLLNIWSGYSPGESEDVRMAAALVLCFRNNRPMVSGCTVDFITPGVDDRLAVDVVDEGHQAVLEFMLGSDADMAQ